MLQRLWPLALFLGLSELARAGCDDPFERPDEIVDFHLEMADASFQELLRSEPSDPTCNGQYPYFEARFRCGDETEWLTIGVRKKRDRSGTDFKPPLKLDFNRFVAGQRWPRARGDLGFRKLTLNSGQPDDPGGPGNEPGSAPGVLSAIATEHLAWRLMREELPEAGGVAYVRLTLHSAETGKARPQGLHVLIEDIDRTGVRARFGADRGLLLKTTWPDCREQVVFDDGPPNSATLAFEEWTQLDPGDFPGRWVERSDDAMHLDALLRQEALRELFGNTEDSILGRMSNYFSLDLFDQRRFYLPWDLDDVFRPQPQLRSPQTELVSSCVGRGGNCAPIPLGVNLRDNAEVRPRYLAALCNVANGTGNEAKVTAELDAIDALIRPVIAEEVPVLWAPRGLDPLDADTPGTYAAEVERLRAWIPERVRAVRRMIEAEGVACEAGCREGTTILCETWEGPAERTCRGGRFEPCVAGATAPDGGVTMGRASEESGCGCRVGRRPPRTPALGIGLGLLAICWRRRASGSPDAKSPRLADGSARWTPGSRRNRLGVAGSRATLLR